MSRNALKWLLPLALIAAFAAGALFDAYVLESRPQQAVYRKQGILTNSLLGFEVNTRGEFAELKPIENAIREFIDERMRERKTKVISVYFRLLNSGRWFTINGEEQYSPASLLKIPVMMAYYKQAEENPSILEKRWHIDGTFADKEQESVPVNRKIETGSTYTVDDLIGRMIRESNNEATNVLQSNLSSDYFKKIYDELEVESPYAKPGYSGEFMQVTDYPFFLRVLYNTTYLNEKYSEKALQLLAETTYSKGIPAKLPPDIIVAHKYGYRIEPDLQFAELHDCGIVYFPDHPYLICIMTKGYDSDVLTSTIQDISLLTYKGVDDFFH